MTAEVKFTEDAREDFQELDRSTQRQILKGLIKLQTSPEQRGLPLGKKIIGDLTKFRRLVVGNRDYRIIYKVEEDGALVIVLVIARRADDDCYEIAVNRLRMHGDEKLRELAVPLAALIAK